MKYYLSPKYNHKYLLSYLRGDDPFKDVKLLTKEELLNYLYPEANESALVYLMNRYNYTYEIASLYLKDLVKVSSDSGDSKYHFLFSLKQELENEGLLITKKCPLSSNSEVEIIEYSSLDFELVNVLKALNVKYSFFNNSINKDDREIKEFKYAEEEVIYALNEIARLIDGGVNIKDIYILNRNETYNYYLNKFSNGFGFKVNIKNNESLFNKESSKLFLRLYKDNKDVESSLSLLKEEMKDDEGYLDVEEVIRNSVIKEANFEIQFDYFENKLKNAKCPSVKYDQAVNVITNPISVKGKYIFVLSFIQGMYPKSFKDSGYLTGEELNRIGRLSNKNLTKIDEDNLLRFLSSENKIHLSYSKNSVDGNHFLSPLTTSFKYHTVNVPLSDIFYSEEALKLVFSNLKDLEHYYHEDDEEYHRVNDVIDIEYNNYSNKYSGDVNAFDDSSEIKLSTSSLTEFNKCPFKYYLENVVNIEPNETNYHMELGKLAHSVFEHCREDGFDFDKYYDELVKTYEYSPSEKYIITHSIKEQIRKAVDVILLREKRYVSPKFYNEQYLRYYLNNKTYISGRIDSLITLNDQYYICIDYKTGSEKFDDKLLKFGLSSQLPTYLLLANSSKEFKNLTPIGIYINGVTTNSLKPEIKDGEEVPEYLKLSGKTLGDLDKIDYIDSTFRQGSSKFIKGIKILSDGSRLDCHAPIVSSAGFNDYVLTVKNQYELMEQRLRNNEFNISPYFISDRDNGCSYCKHRDICFMRNSDFHILKEEEKTDE